ncbi:MAG TPA: hypothetical protein VG056_09195 [Pirellulales bacterium]|jgi:hypothetical protein|nr:hypothetical protein [Pirellulales bacterium]
MKDNLLALAGAIVGGAIGFLGFGWLLGQGFYALVLPGGFCGIGAGWVFNRSILVAIICGVMATVLGLVAEWHFRPFNADDSLGFYFRHLGDLQPITILMIVLGGAIGFWVPFRRLERIANSELPQ